MIGLRYRPSLPFLSIRNTFLSLKARCFTDLGWIFYDLDDSGKKLYPNGVRMFGLPRLAEHVQNNLGTFTEGVLALHSILTRPARSGILP